MGSSFELILDTTGPNIEILAPSHTTPSIRTDIKIKASEKLGSYQEFYFIDAAGVRHDVILSHSEDEYNGSFYFNDFPVGILTFYARVKDEVNNISALESVSINLMERAYIEIDIGSLSMTMDLSESTMIVDHHELIQETSLERRAREMDLGVKTGRIEVEILDG